VNGERGMRKASLLRVLLSDSSWWLYIETFRTVYKRLCLQIKTVQFLPRLVSFQLTSCYEMRLFEVTDLGLLGRKYEWRAKRVIEKSETFKPVVWQRKGSLSSQSFSTVNFMAVSYVTNALQVTFDRNITVVILLFDFGPSVVLLEYPPIQVSNRISVLSWTSDVITNASRSAISEAFLIVTNSALFGIHNLSTRFQIKNKFIKNLTVPIHDYIQSV